ncbi:MAG TPA: hypothetical protein VF791_12625 [Pyrinomonadaceae bacterium]
MKAVTAKLLAPFIGILLVAPFFAIALIVGARVVALSHGAQDDLLLVALALGGAVASIINGMGRHALREKSPHSNEIEATTNSVSRQSSMIHLGY